MNNTKRSKENLKPFSCGTLHIVATPIGNLKDITFRAVETLQNVDLIACEDTRQTRKLLDYYGIKTKCIVYHEHSKTSAIENIVQNLKQGSNIALVSDAGTPLISDPGQPLIKSAIEEGIKIVPIPGANAAISALSCSGIASDHFTFIGFLPNTKVARKAKLIEFSTDKNTLIFYESPNRINALLEDILTSMGDRNVVIARELTKIYEEFIRGKVSDVLAKPQDFKGECVVILEGCKEIAITDAEITSHLSKAMEIMSLKDSVELVSNSLKQPKKAVYTLALQIKKK